MWHEARKQERKIRGMIVDYRKRAERRQDFYEKIQADPTQFIQIHGRRCKIHLDPAVATAGDGAAIIVPWHGQQDNLIDRFDVRAHLDYIPLVPKNTDLDCNELSLEERQCNYERYRILAQNDFLNLPEEKFLHQLYLEEQYGANAQLEAERNLGKKKNPRTGGATIGYSYEDTDTVGGPQPFSHILNISQVPGQSHSVDQNEDEDDSDSDIDMDVSIDISKLDTSQAHELNSCGRNYGMLSNDFYSYLTKDVDEADAMRMAREEEQEKMLLSGRKSRRERRAQKERRVAGRPFSPPSYAAKEEPSAAGEENHDNDESDSRSPSPSENAGKITYITSFGGEDELQPHSKISINLNTKSQTIGIGAAKDLGSTSGQPTYAQKVRENLDKLKLLNDTSRRKAQQNKHSSHRWSTSKSRSPSRTRERRRRSRSRSRSGGYRKYQRRGRSRSSSYRERSKHRRKSHSRSRRRRYRSSTSFSSRSSSSASSNANRRRGYQNQRSKSRSKTQSPSPIKQIQQKISNIIKPKPVVSTPTPLKIVPVASPIMKVSEKVQYPPMISYPVRAFGAIPLQQLNDKPKAQPQPQLPPQEPPPPLKRYYGRKRADDNSSDSDSDNGENPGDTECNDGNNDQNSHIGSNSQPDDDNNDEERMDVDTICSDHSNRVTSPVGDLAFSDKHLSGQATCLSRSSETKGGGAGGGSSCNSRFNLRDRLKRKMQILLNKQYKADKRAEIEKTERERLLQQEREDEMRELALKLRRRQRELRHKYGKETSNKSGSKSSESDTNESAKAKIEKSPLPSRSPSHASEKLSQNVCIESEQTNRTNRHRSDRPRNRSRSTSRDRRRSRSRSRSNSRRSRSRSRNRRSKSRRRNRSPSRSDRHWEASSDRSRYNRERPHERHRRSRSINNTQDRYRASNRDRQRDNERNWVESSAEGRGAGPSDSTSYRNHRNRVVISAPPKLKKLVDY